MSQLGAPHGHLSAVQATPEFVTVRAPGKVNLSLRVGERESDGYHPLVTVFQAVSLYEEVVVSPASTFSLKVTGPGAEHVPLDESNLALCAARALAAHTGVNRGARIEIVKGIPVAGGMAGGSADAAATLVALDALWGTSVSRTDLLQIGSTLGADVPFSIQGHTAVGTGRGDLLSPVMVQGEFFWAFALRAEGLSTPKVFREFDRQATPHIGARDDAFLPPEADSELIAALRAGDAVRLGRCLSNDLQEPALALAPDLARTIAVAQGAGACGVVVSGSGPTVAALAGSHDEALAIAAELMSSGTCAAVVCASGPVPGARVVS